MLYFGEANGKTKHSSPKGGRYSLRSSAPESLHKHKDSTVTENVVASYYGKKVKQSSYRPVEPRGFQEVKVPRLCDSGPEWW